MRICAAAEGDGAMFFGQNANLFYRHTFCAHVWTGALGSGVRPFARAKVSRAKRPHPAKFRQISSV
jgi:hypothetical protein